jgi:branched-chain amino acid transport system permease protein
MDSTIFLLLLQDGLTTGAIYVLLAIGLLLVFSVTRVIFIPQGDFVAFGTLSLTTLQTGHLPGTLWLMDVLSVVAGVLSVAQRRDRLTPVMAWNFVYPAVVTLACYAAARSQPWFGVMMLLSIAIVAPLGALVYRFAFQPVASGSVLMLLILSMAVHFVLLGLGLIFFGAEGSRTPALSDASFTVGAIDISGQSICVALCCIVLVAVLRWFSGHTIQGKALRAAASNPLGARLMGIGQAATGRQAFLLAALIAALAGILIGPITPISYDTGFEIGLKGFVAAIIGGLASYPAAAAGALVVGVLESLSSFWASAYSNVIVFSLLIPVLVVLSLRRGSGDDRA